MLDLYLILIPAVLLVILAGLWIIRGMSLRAKFFGKGLIVITATSVAGLITVSYVSSIVGVIALTSVCGWLLYKRRPK